MTTAARSPMSLHIEATLGTRMWVVAPRLTDALRAKGYEVAVSPAKFKAIIRSYTPARIIADARAA